MDGKAKVRSRDEDRIVTDPTASLPRAACIRVRAGYIVRNSEAGVVERGRVDGGGDTSAFVLHRVLDRESCAVRRMLGQYRGECDALLQNG